MQEMQQQMKIIENLHPSFCHVAEKVFENKRLSREDGLFLFSTPHISSLQLLADYARQQTAGDDVYYTSSLHLYPTNICEIECPLCCFYAKPGEKNSWQYTIEELTEKVKKYLPHDIQEVHIAGGINRTYSLPYYLGLIRSIRKIAPKIFIKALTAVEIVFLAKHSSLSIEKTLALLVEAGLDCISSGGAEILDDRIRDIIAPKKIKSDQFLEIHSIAHNMGIKSNISMLFNHVETIEDILTHFEKVRAHQDKTGGFTCFVPLKYFSSRNALSSHLQIKKDPKRIIALSRLMLDNVKNIKVLWNYLGVNEAKELLLYGGNDMGSSAIEEQVAPGNEQIDEEMMKVIISSIGRRPKKRPMQVKR